MCIRMSDNAIHPVAVVISEASQDSWFWRFPVAKHADIIRGVIDLRQLTDTHRLLALTFINCVLELIQPAARETSRGGPVWQ